jgi:hypothetical protein
LLRSKISNNSIDMRKAIRIFILWIAGASLFVACDKEKHRVIPYVPVYLTINLNIVNELMVPENSVFFGDKDTAVSWCIVSSRATFIMPMMEHAPTK